MSSLKTKKSFSDHVHENGSDEGYGVISEKMSVQDKVKVLETLGRPELIEIFKEWTPRQAKSRKKAVPLDQRVSITVTDKERFDLQKDLEGTNKIGEKITISQFIRNRSMGSIDINGWGEIAERALSEIIEIEDNKADLRKRRRQLQMLIENEDDNEEIALYDKELASINFKFKKITSQNELRKNRLSGRMSMAEAETIKWRAARLSLSTSDYLRFMIFDLLPDSHADGHLSLDAKKRFYVSILNVRENGWGDPPTIAHCVQCTGYLDEIRKLRDRVKQLEAYV